MEKQELITMCKAKRKELGLSQQDIANKLGWHKTRISEFEGNKTNFTSNKLLLIMSAYGLSIS